MTETILTVVAILLILTVPIGIVQLTRRVKFFGIIGAVALCYLVGFALSTIGLSGYSYDKGLTTTIAYVLVAISLPLVLFSIDLRSVKKLAKVTVVGYALCIVSAIVVAAAMFGICYGFFPDSPKLAAMTIGLYTGGTPNMLAIGAMLKESTETITAANVSDSVVGGIYFLLIISIGPKLYRALLKNRKKKLPTTDATETTATNEAKESEIIEQTAKDDYRFGFSIKEGKKVGKLIGAFFLAVGCVGVGAVLELLIAGTVGEDLLYILLSVSVLGIAFSFVKPIRKIEGQYTLGMYLILMFSIALSMSIDWSVFLSGILPTLGFFACAQVSVILLHLLLCKIFRVDGDTALITSTAGIYGPPFIAPVAKAANRSDLIAPGIICGALGLAIGTLLGWGIGMLFLLFV